MLFWRCVFPLQITGVAPRAGKLLFFAPHPSLLLGTPGRRRLWLAARARPRTSPSACPSTSSGSRCCPRRRTTSLDPARPSARASTCRSARYWRHPALRAGTQPYDSAPGAAQFGFQRPATRKMRRRTQTPAQQGAPPGARDLKNVPRAVPKNAEYEVCLNRNISVCFSVL